jgi:hypothetical protein
VQYSNALVREHLIEEEAGAAPLINHALRAGAAVRIIYERRLLLHSGLRRDEQSAK